MTNVPLSSRLLACAAFVRPGERVADVGCDHGYLSLHLLQSGVAGYVYASDVREGPLGSARRPFCALDFPTLWRYNLLQKKKFYKRRRRCTL